MQPFSVLRRALRARAPVLFTAGLLAAAGVAHAAGDPKRGESVFANECNDCHSPRHVFDKKGPSLVSVVGRTAGTWNHFNYSDAMKAAGFAWTPEKIDAYITAPKKVVPGGRMKYSGLGDAQARADVIAYITSPAFAALK